MTQDEILEMARQTGVLAGYEGEPSLFVIFAKALMDVEREACAKVCEELAELSRTSDTDSMWEWGECAAAIRARGEQHE